MQKVILEEEAGLVEVVIGDKTQVVDAVTEFGEIQKLLDGRGGMGVAQHDFTAEYIEKKFGVKVSRGLASQYVQVITEAVAALKKNTPMLHVSPTTSTSIPEQSPPQNDTAISPTLTDSLPNNS